MVMKTNYVRLIKYFLIIILVGIAVCAFESAFACDTQDNINSQLANVQTQITALGNHAVYDAKVVQLNKDWDKTLADKTDSFVNANADYLAGNPIVRQPFYNTAKQEMIDQVNADRQADLDNLKAQTDADNATKLATLNAQSATILAESVCQTQTNVQTVVHEVVTATPQPPLQQVVPLISISPVKSGTSAKDVNKLDIVVNTTTKKKIIKKINCPIVLLSCIAKYKKS